MAHRLLACHDILTIIADYTLVPDYGEVYKTKHVSYFLVCKAFYAAWVAKVWRAIALGKLGKGLRGDAGAVFAKHQEYIRELWFEDLSPQLWDEYEALFRAVFAHVASPLCRVWKVTVDSEVHSFPRSAITALLRCRSLTTLCFPDFRISSGDVELFLQLCSRMPTLLLQQGWLGTWPLSSPGSKLAESLDFSAVRTLKIGPLHVGDIRVDGDMVSLCSNLQTLRLYWVDRQSRHFETFAKNFSRLRDLHTLDVSDVISEDEQLGAILENISMLRELHASNCAFGSRTWEALTSVRQQGTGSARRLCSTLEVLEVGTVTSIAPEWFTLFMENAPLLQRLLGAVVPVSDFVASRNWVCMDLIYLEVCILPDEEGDGVKRLDAIASQLLQLEKLQILVLTVSQSRDPVRYPLTRYGIHEGYPPPEFMRLRDLTQLWGLVLNLPCDVEFMFRSEFFDFLRDCSNLKQIKFRIWSPDDEDHDFVRLPYNWDDPNALQQFLGERGERAILYNDEEWGSSDNACARLLDFLRREQYGFEI